MFRGFLSRFAGILDEFCIDLNRFEVAMSQPSRDCQKLAHILSPPYLLRGISIAEAVALHIGNAGALYIQVNFRLGG